MIATDVENAVAAQKIEIRLVIHVIEIRALGTCVDFVETDHTLCCHERAVYVPLVQFVIFAKTRGNNLLQIESHQEENSAIRDRNANPLAASLRRVTIKKAAGFRQNPAAQLLRIKLA